MAEEFKIIAKIVTDDKQAKVSAETTGKEIAKSVDKGTKNIKVGENINKSLDKVKKNTFADGIKGKLEDVKKGIEAIGVGGDRLTKIGDFFQGGMIAAFAAAALAAGAALKKMWDDAHESAEQYYERMQKNQEVLDKAIEKSQAENQATNEWFNRLHEINQLEKISNAQKAEAAILIDALTRRYGQLGITVNGTTGKYQNLYEAQLKVLDLQYQAELRLRQQKRDSYTGSGGTAHVATSALMKDIGAYRGSNLAGVKSLSMIDMDKYDYHWNKALNMGLDIKMRETPYAEKITYSNGNEQVHKITLSEEDIKYNRLWNSGGLQGKLQWIRYMRNHPSYRGDSDFHQSLNNLEKQIMDAMVASEQYSAFRATGKPSEQKSLQDIAAQNRRIQQEEASGEAVVKQGAERRRIQQQQAEYQALNTQGKIDWQTRKNTEAQTEIERATAEVAKLQAEYEQSDKALANTIKNGDKNKIEIAQKKHLELLQKLNTEKKNLQTAKNDEQASRLERSRLQEQLQREQNTSGAKNEKKQKKDAEFEMKYQKLLLQGRYREAERLKIINDLKRQGLKIDEAEIKALLKRKLELNNLKKQKDLVSMGQGLISQHGTSQEKLLQEYKNLTQGITDKGLKADYWRLLKLRDGLTNLPDVEAFQAQSNELTRRGGFRTAYIDNADKINRQIADNTKKTNEFLSEIKRINEKNGRY